jgi:hypothetical protein
MSAGVCREIDLFVVVLSQFATNRQLLQCGDDVDSRQRPCNTQNQQRTACTGWVEESRKNVTMPDPRESVATRNCRHYRTDRTESEMPFSFSLRRLIRQKCFWAMLACLCVAHAAAAADRPNILFIFSDDHAPHAIGAYNGWLKSVNPTPNIDKLAAQGTLFENSFCTNSICGPSGHPHRQAQP